MKWEDTTSYQRGERGRAEPRVWSLGKQPYKISVHRYTGLDGWFMSCFVLDIDTYDLKTNDLKTARERALVKVQKALNELNKNMLDLIEEAE